MELPLDQIICHDVSKPFPLPDNCIDMVMTSPPYWGLRDYQIPPSIWGGKRNCKHQWKNTGIEHDNLRYRGENSIVGNEKNKDIHKGKEGTGGQFCSRCGAWRGQLGLEPDPQLFIDHLMIVFDEVKRVLKPTGSFYLNIGDTYFGGGQGGGNYGGKEVCPKERYGHVKAKKNIPWLKGKQLMLMPSRVAIALQEGGWILRNDICWHKRNSMPTSAKDRLNDTYEHVYHLVLKKRYYYDLDAIREPHKAQSLIRGKYGFNHIPAAWNKGVIPVSGGKKVDIHLHEAGKNPGDIVEYDGKYKNSMPHFQNISERKNYERQILKVPHDLSTSHPLGKNPGDFWSFTTQPFTAYREDLEHFAVFPEALVRKPLLSSCPREICKKCGKPRTRITKGGDLVFSEKAHKSKGYTGSRGSKMMNVGNGDLDSKAAHLKRDGIIPGMTRIHETVGWSDCGCNAGFEPGVVLDPFCGRGTVGKVAKDLGLHYILFDIKPEYCELARLFIAGQKYKLHKDQSKLKV